MRQRVTRDLGQRTRQLDARRAAPDHHERQQPPGHLRVIRLFGALERQEHALTDPQRIGQRLEPGCSLAPFVVAKVRMGGAGGHDEVVVVQRPAPIFRPHLDDALPGIDRGRLSEHDPRIVVAA